MKSTKSWYLIAYDIREPKRLRRLHYRLRKRAIPLQNSVFMVKLTDKHLKQLSNEIKKHINTAQDDVRIYPIHHPDTLWSAGKQVHALRGLYAGAKKYQKPKKIGLIKRLLGVSS